MDFLPKKQSDCKLLYFRGMVPEIGYNVSPKQTDFHIVRTIKKEQHAYLNCHCRSCRRFHGILRHPCTFRLNQVPSCRFLVGGDIENKINESIANEVEMLFLKKQEPTSVFDESVKGCSESASFFAFDQTREKVLSPIKIHSTFHVSNLLNEGPACASHLTLPIVNLHVIYCKHRMQSAMNLAFEQTRE